MGKLPGDPLIYILVRGTRDAFVALVLVSSMAIYKCQMTK